MMRFLKLAVLLPLIAFGGLSACSKVPAGYAGVKVHLLGTDKGVDHEVLGVGRYFIGWNEELFKFPTFTQNVTWEGENAITFQTREGMKVVTPVGISYYIHPDKVGSVFEKYRKGIDEITSIYLRNAVRDAFVKVASTKMVDSVYGAGKAQIVAEVEKLVRDRVGPIGIEVEQIFLAGDMVLPESVTRALDAKIEATQLAAQRQNEIETTKAEAQKAIEQAKGEAQAIRTRAEAEAEANRIVAQSLTPELVEYRAIERWSGELPRLMGGGATPFIDVTPETEGK